MPAWPQLHLQEPTRSGHPQLRRLLCFIEFDRHVRLLLFSDQSSRRSARGRSVCLDRRTPLAPFAMRTRRVPSTPPSRSASTAAAQRARTARCNGATPLLSIALGSAPAAMRHPIVATCASGFQAGKPGTHQQRSEWAPPRACFCADVGAFSDQLGRYCSWYKASPAIRFKPALMASPGQFGKHNPDR